MILIDTPVWVDHLANGDEAVASLLSSGRVVMHPFIVGELALGNLRQRELVIASLEDLPHAVLANDDEVLDFIGRHRVAGTGIGYIDVHLLASTMLTPHAALWIRDKRLAQSPFG